ncbi:MAG: hypothetical protein R3279_08980 [Putridiphycobacter sp.]|nr:hypothetical protein [Putridiphycobacter sp.]
MKNLNSTRPKKEKEFNGFDLGLLMIGYKFLSPAKTVKKATK